MKNELEKILQEAITRHRHGQMGQALSNYERLGERSFPEPLESLRNRWYGSCLLAHGRHSEALEKLSLVVIEDIRDASWHYDVAASSYKLNKYEVALEHVDTCLAKSQEHLAACVLRANILLGLDRAAEAKSWIEQSQLNKHIHVPAVFHVLYLCEFILGRMSACKELYAQCTPGVRDDQQTNILLINYLLREEQVNQANEILAKLKPKDTTQAFEIKILEIKCAMASGEFDLARTYLDKLEDSVAGDRDVTRTRLHQLTYDLLYRSRDYRGALKFLRERLRHKAEPSYYIYELAQTLYKLGRFKLALKALNSLSRINGLANGKYLLRINVELNLKGPEAAYKLLSNIGPENIGDAQRLRYNFALIAMAARRPVGLIDDYSTRFALIDRLFGEKVPYQTVFKKNYLVLKDFNLIQEQGIGDFLIALNAAINFSKQRGQHTLLRIYCDERLLFIQDCIKIPNLVLRPMGAITRVGDIDLIPMSEIFKISRQFGLNPFPETTMGIVHQAREPISVGLSWYSTNAEYAADKSHELVQFLKYAPSTAKEFTLLQSPRPTDEQALNGQYRRLKNPEGDLQDTVMVMRNLDLIVTCSNTLAHIAGFFKIPTVLVLKKNQVKFWYWQEALSGTKVSSWYPSISYRLV